MRLVTGIQVPDAQIAGLINDPEAGLNRDVPQSTTDPAQGFPQFAQQPTQGGDRIQYQIQGVAETGDQVTQFADEIAALIKEFTGRVADAQQLFLSAVAAVPLVVGE